MSIDLIIILSIVLLALLLPTREPDCAVIGHFHRRAALEDILLPAPIHDEFSQEDVNAVTDLVGAEPNRWGSVDPIEIMMATLVVHRTRRIPGREVHIVDTSGMSPAETRQLVERWQERLKKQAC